jgi:hypothetical protein
MTMILTITAPKMAVLAAQLTATPSAGQPQVMFWIIDVLPLDPMLIRLSTKSSNSSPGFQWEIVGKRWGKS